MLEESGAKVYTVSDIPPFFSHIILTIGAIFLGLGVIADAFLCTIVLKKYIQF
jgi:hypothetical protein